mmetsp:Transcript_7078/g.15578  ORF Transcript_7078/g.15578 Transcript_7078/m.15578 type:complete len:228 (+) Transcript_7078:587-1270(+)
MKNLAGVQLRQAAGAEEGRGRVLLRGESSRVGPPDRMLRGDGVKPQRRLRAVGPDEVHRGEVKVVGRQPRYRRRRREETKSDRLQRRVAPSVAVDVAARVDVVEKGADGRLPPPGHAAHEEVGEVDAVHLAPRGRQPLARGVAVEPAGERRERLHVKLLRLQAVRIHQTLVLHCFERVRIQLLEADILVDAHGEVIVRKGLEPQHRHKTAHVPVSNLAVGQLINFYG